MKTAVVTGGTKGIGLALAGAFFGAGYVVHALYASDGAAAEEAQKALPFVRFVRCDVRDEGAVTAFFASLPRVDVLVNNAGVSLVKQIQDTSKADLDALFAVNVTGAFLCAREAVKKMLKQESGSIVNVSSVWGETGASCEVAYSASKAAIIGLTKALAKEVAPSRIRVNCVSPGVVDTGMNDHLSEEEKSALAEEIPLGRFAAPREIAQAILFLAESEYITGAVLPVNGGFCI